MVLYALTKFSWKDCTFAELKSVLWQNIDTTVLEYLTLHKEKITIKISFLSYYEQVIKYAKVVKLSLFIL